MFAASPSRAEIKELLNFAPIPSGEAAGSGTGSVSERGHTA